MNRLLLFVLATAIAVAGLTPARAAAESERRAFDLPADAGDKSLSRFAAQAGVEVIFGSATAAQVHTNAVKGTYGPREALALLLANTGLVATRDEQTGAMMISRDPNARRAALAGTSVRPESRAAGSDEPIVLSPFEVTTTADAGYRATNSQVATGFNRDVQRTPLTINIITDEFMRDAGIRSYAELTEFLPNTYVEGDLYNIGSTATARGHGTSYYAQDGRRYYTEPHVASGQRIEAIKGPATLFFGRAQPGGILNFTTPPPSARERRELTAIYGPVGVTELDASVQGKVFGREWLTFRTDATLREGETWVDCSKDDLKFIRAVIGVRLWENRFTLRLKYEYSFRDQSGFARATQVILPQYYADYNAPRPEQMAWAKAPGRAGANATDAQAVTYLRNRWLRTGSSNWSLDTAAAFGLVSAPVYRIGLRPSPGSDRWSYNASQDGSIAQKTVYDWGAVATYTPNRHLSFKASGYKYDLYRHRLDGDMSLLDADLRVRNNIGNTANLNATSNFSLEGVANYGLGPTRHTTHLGGLYFKDYFSRVDGLFYGLNALPDGGIDIRRSTNTVATSGWNPLTQPYDNLRRYVQTVAKNRPLVINGMNYENAIYGSQIIELFDGRVGLLLGGRHQEYENRLNGYELTANVYTVGVSWEVKKDLVLFASSSTSFEPGMQAMVEGAGTTLDERNGLPAPPREGQGFDVGVKFNLPGGNLAGSIAYFETARRNDFRSVDRTRTDADQRNTDSNANNNVTWYEYGGERLSKGVDLELFWKPVPGYQAVATLGYLPTAQIISNPSIPLVTLPDGTRVPDPNADNSPGMRSPNSPKYTASLWNRYAFSDGLLAGSGIGLGLSYSAEAAINASPLERIYAPGSTLVRLALDRRFKLGGNSLHLSLLITNLLDEKYYRGRDRGSPRAVSLRAAFQF